MRVGAIRPQDPAQGEDHDRDGAGPAQSRRRALRPGTADVGVVEQQHAPTGHGGSQRRRDRERPRLGAHVADGRPGAGEQLGRPDGAGNPRADGRCQPFHTIERRATGSRRGGHREHERRGTARGGGHAGGMAGQEAVEQREHHRAEAPAGLADR